MPIFIKTGLWEKASKGFKGWLNLDDLVSASVPTELSQLSDDVVHRTVTDMEKALWNAKEDNLFNQYTVFISQTGTNAPTVTSLLKDDLSTPVWAYSAVGTYTLTKAGAFIEDKTLPLKDVYTDIDGNYMTLERTDENTMTLKTYAAADTTVLANDVLTNQYLNIEIYL
jgi:hypothetical protein